MNRLKIESCRLKIAGPSYHCLQDKGLFADTDAYDIFW
jgi:hypothetical protein